MIDTLFRNFLKLHGRCFLSASFSGHTIKYFKYSARIGSQPLNILETATGLILNRNAKSLLYNPSLSFIILTANGHEMIDISRFSLIFHQSWNKPTLNVWQLAGQ